MTDEPEPTDKEAEYTKAKEKMLKYLRDNNIKLEITDEEWLILQAEEESPN